jgi:hypothetical protein
MAIDPKFQFLDPYMEHLASIVTNPANLKYTTVACYCFRGRVIVKTSARPQAGAGGDLGLGFTKKRHSRRAGARDAPVTL